MIPQFYKQFQHWSARGTVWLYSDPHFGDKELSENIKCRPGDEEQLRRINAKVGKHDTLILLGDVGDIEYAKRLKGYKVLICGNHDVGHTIYEEIFDEVYPGVLTIGEKIILSHEPIDVTWALNIHGHVHHKRVKNDKYHFNVCADAINYEPVNMNKLMKSGILANIETIHRFTINGATQRKKERDGKKYGSKNKVE